MSSFSEDFDDLISYDFSELFDPLDHISEPLADFSSIVEEYDQDLNLQYNITDGETSLSTEISESPLQACSYKGSTEKLSLPKLECGVCGAPARCYNFGQITCDSCKAFFRRNALRDMSKLHCCYGGKCVIDINTRRQCTYCRLKKCLSIKMRKDWIRTDEEKQLRHLLKTAKEKHKVDDIADYEQTLLSFPTIIRRKKHSKKQRVSQELVHYSMNENNYFFSNRVLCVEDRALLNNINNTYALVVDKTDFSYIDRYPFTTTFSQFINDERVMNESLINFFRLIPEFTQLDLHDQIVVVKSNLTNILLLHHLIVHRFQECSHLGILFTKWINVQFYNDMARTRRYFYRFMNNPLLLKLALIVLIFSVNLSISHGNNECYEYGNEKLLFVFQNYYTNILWRYLVYLYGEKEAVKSMTIIVTQILQYQLLMVTMDDYVSRDPDRAQYHSLMKSVFGLT